MSRKQLRISDPTQLKQRSGEFINKKINIVLKDNTVLFGEVKKVDEDQVYMMNMRLKTIRLPLSTILEFYVDLTS